MSQIMKTYVGLFFLMFLSFTAVGILGAFLRVMSAQDVHAQIVQELEESDFYPDVAEQCFAEAEQAGGRLSLTFYSGGQSFLCTSATEIPSDLSGVDLARVELDFPFCIALMGVNEEHSFVAYAR